MDVCLLTKLNQNQTVLYVIIVKFRKIMINQNPCMKPLLNLAKPNLSY
jgi:hypothetical protein